MTWFEGSRQCRCLFVALGFDIIRPSETLSQLLPYPYGPRLAAVPSLLVLEFTILAKAPSQPAKLAGHSIAVLTCGTGARIIARSAATEAIKLCLLSQESGHRIVRTLSSGAAQGARKPNNGDDGSNGGIGSYS